MEQEENPHALQIKTTKGAISKVLKETAGWTQPGLIFGMSTLVSTKFTLDIKRSRRSKYNSRQFSGYMQMDPSKWLDVSM